jgi:nucleoside 2-deoxyribosyltransferase
MFNSKHLVGNAYLAEAVYEKSHGRFECILPQNLDTSGMPGRSIRDLNLRTLLDCDLALFNFDGTELDSGTVVEFMFAKFADIPAVLLRTDVRGGGGEHRAQPWNLMAASYPRTTTVVTAGFPAYRQVNLKHKRLPGPTRLAGQYSTAAAQVVCDRTATMVVNALERILRTDPIMPKHLRVEVYNWLAIMPKFHGRPKELRKALEKVLERKVRKDLL